MGNVTNASVIDLMHLRWTSFPTYSIVKEITADTRAAILVFKRNYALGTFGITL